ncbi:hypothetical protein ACNS7O_18055 (plasmid) [Haloferacaceae archaeon DSL9]
MISIEAVGTSLPAAQIDAEALEEAPGGCRARGVKRKTVAAFDEDSVTMGIDAAKCALEASAHDRREIEQLAVATTTPPIDEGDIAATVATALGLERSTETIAVTQSGRAGTQALLWAARVATGPALVVSADQPRGAPDDAVEHAAGAGAVAFVLSSSGAVELTDSAAHTDEYPGTRFRRRGRDVTEIYGATAYDRGGYTGTVSSVLSRLEDRPTAVAPTAPNGSLPHRIGKSVDGEATVYERASTLGDLGVAGPFFGLLSAWDDGVDRIAVVGFGDGASADAVVLDGRLAVPAERDRRSVSYAEYLRLRGEFSETGGDR